MSSPKLSPAGSPPRRALHERTPSQNNSRSPSPSVRLVQEKQDANVYSANPFPSKPNMVFLPRPGKGQSFSRSSHEPDDVSSPPSSPAQEDSKVDTSMASTWDQCSTIDTVNTSSHLWEDDPKSSQSSFPVYSPSQAGTIRDPDTRSCSSASTRRGPHEEESDDDDDEEEEEDEIIQLPVVRSTVNLVSPEFASDPATLPSSSSFDASADGQPSSPNFVPIGLPSSPNLVSLASSSPILMPLGSSSPNIVPVRQLDTSSMVSGSSNSAGTVVRTYAQESGSGEDASSDNASSHPASFRSSPPEQLLRVYRSTSSLALPGPLSNRSRSATVSSRGTYSTTDTAGAAVDSSPPVQYAAIRGSSVSSSFAEAASLPESNLKRPARAVTSERWNPQLPPVPSQMSNVGESSSSAKQTSLTPMDSRSNLDNHRFQTESTVKLIDDSSSEEHLDSVSSLPQGILRHFSSFLTMKSSSSRSDSMRSLRRPASSSSLVAGAFPKWARLYYLTGESTLQNSILTMADGSRPPTATRPGSPSRQAPAALTRPRNRPRQNTAQRQLQRKLVMDHPADPRTHWRRIPGEDQPTPTDHLPATHLYNSLSPHLHPDKCQQGRRNLWKAPSVDSTAEPLLGRRNIQKYSFCFGFIFPLSMLEL
jgi:hypothetical protein